jgi:hypothetical protein
VVGIKIVRSEEEHEESEGGSSRYPAHRCLEGVAALLDGCGEEGLPCALRILRGIDYDFGGICSCAQHRGSWAVLGDEDTLVIDSDDFYVEPACWVPAFESIPQRLKPLFLVGFDGGAEAPPLQKGTSREIKDLYENLEKKPQISALWSKNISKKGPRNCRSLHYAPPDFLWNLAALVQFMRPSLRKGAYAALSSAAWQEIRVRSGRDDKGESGASIEPLVVGLKETAGPSTSQPRFPMGNPGTLRSG